MNKTKQKYLEKAQDLLKYCVTCQPYEGGDYIWVLGEETTVDEIFDEINCPERYRDEIAEHLVCDNCSADITSRYDTVGKEDRYEIELQDFVKKSLKEYGKELLDFYHFLEQYPSLGQSTVLGRKLFKEINAGQLPVIAVKNKEWIRVRDVTSSKILGEEDMKAPPLGLSSDGRYNHAGQSNLYLAIDEETAVREVIGEDKSCIIWRQKFLIKSLENILDLKHEWTSLNTTLNSIFIALLSSEILEKKVLQRGSTWKPEYFITQFIGDCARYAGYSGIRYNSTKKTGENLVVFDPQFLIEKQHIIHLEQPQVITYNPKEEEEYIWNFDDLPF
ncbi:RES family NAD+ phosphorylase [Bacillus toyonensis]|uniref:RES domain-containing protein n=1 Tax=Bacillus toyonensis TaxID=155322 RepID=A0AB73RMH5_9BACI|nr:MULTISPECIES: RES family NAD+ phosphorylase [Bacillus]KAF6552407.1 RES family NAD+ phosphorylase [Bacillus sp. EKM202B]MCU5727992.1 RES family NAD+ phosphorylase [Bacillus toyonensis]PEI83093.1 hypothetical protein CN678_25765 [Bacillus toyonensis]HDR7431266.1 RES family NAD+ phosphorylase [Bacillus toyonensis]